eukprot:CAMPEP_0183556016 /NCGR_PEP_ID=MMETSP0371-20130417/81267_1 /TAXON_ID=268820 /ORGANISM="Peridinium aciculiferum, Strain PAER-2" /LENGTH=99 /DNA_ID=CAMNT_0025762457 /DNA_START=122 /DNA_END=422 /DNA_ORIENTATION=-
MCAIFRTADDELFDRIATSAGGPLETVPACDSATAQACNNIDQPIAANFPNGLFLLRLRTGLHVWRGRLGLWLHAGGTSLATDSAQRQQPLPPAKVVIG